MVITPAKTGNDNNNNHAVTKIDQANSGTLCRVMPGARIFRNVVIILIDPKIELAPDTWMAKIAKSTARDTATSLADNGG